jgi:hypothetical protein
MPSQRAPGPDGFIGMFYKKCWDIVRSDLSEALCGFYNLRTNKLHLVNEANIVLLPKKENALHLTDFRPINLINSLAKIITKVLAERLAPKLGQLVSRSQNAFIKGRCIRDNFLYVQRVKSKKPSLFIKLDISKAFDSVSWAYLLVVLEAFGFGRKWRNWISAILASSSSRIFMNGRLGRKIVHKRGLRQGDSLSPILFILAIDPLQRIIGRAIHSSVLSHVLPKSATLYCSLYADDAGLFAKPSASDLYALRRILQTFSDCSGLKFNMSKTELYPIRCHPGEVEALLHCFPGKIASFPGKYLGLPLHTRKLRRIEMQPLVDKIRARLLRWKGKLLSKAGRLTLVNTVVGDLFSNAKS